MELHANEKKKILARHWRVCTTWGESCSLIGRPEFRLPDNARRLVKNCSDATMAGGRRKFATAHAYGKKRKRRSRIPKAASSGSTATSSATCASGCTTSTEAAAAQAMPVADDTSRTMRKLRKWRLSIARKRNARSFLHYQLRAGSGGVRHRVYAAKPTAAEPTASVREMRILLRPFELETAVAEAVARFNAGKKRASEAILKELHLSQGSTDVERCLEKDQRRPAACDKKHTRAENFRNAMKRRRVKENDSDYVPGGF
ncbi:hypothetical protein HPB52_009576 [Rhipicephalus sanguineus]|uniref:Uncharacterized protein n=1 Tax=Rhipicephalus sanguineus TaxID=34632 RepID=A0A9D4SZU6_RHISA|nr:hypothetical protein HPB52_009576 [Rhipicephalus sanguineus]